MRLKDDMKPMLLPKVLPDGPCPVRRVHHVKIHKPKPTIEKEEPLPEVVEDYIEESHIERNTESVFKAMG